VPENGLARCTIRGCPVRWRGGGDRDCGQHPGGDDTAAVQAAAEALGIDLGASGKGLYGGGGHGGTGEQ